MSVFLRPSKCSLSRLHLFPLFATVIPVRFFSIRMCCSGFCRTIVQPHRAQAAVSGTASHFHHNCKAAPEYWVLATTSAWKISIWFFVCKQLSRYSTNSKYIAMLVLPQLPPQLAGSVTVLRLTSAAGNATSADLQPRLWWREHLTVDHWFKSCLVRHGELVVSLYLSPSL